MSYVVAREYMERALAVAMAANDRAESRLIQRRICEVLEMEDVNEYRRLHEEPTLDVFDPLDDAEGAVTVIVAESPVASCYQLRYWGDPVLTMPCRPVMALEDLPPGLIDAMRRVVDTASPPGLGLAANQVGALLRVVLVRVAGQKELKAFINPVLSRFSASREHGPEGCLSIPGFQTNLPRSSWLTVDYRDEHWQQHRTEAAGLTARVLQHEVDHLDGKLIVDGLSRQLRRQAERAVEKALGKARA